MTSKENEKRPQDGREAREEGGGIAGEVLRGLGKVIPGLGGLLKGLEKSPAFAERLQATSKEIEARLRETPLRGGGAVGPAGGNFRADVMDEGPFLRVVAELPGFSLEEIGLELQERKLLIFSSKEERAFRHEVALPVAPVRITDTACRNGVLEIKLSKG